MARKVGDRFPCRLCGASREGQPKNSSKVAVCQHCWPDYAKQHNGQHFVSVYLPADLKAQLEDTAQQQAVSPSMYVRLLIKSALAG